MKKILYIFLFVFIHSVFGQETQTIKPLIQTSFDSEQPVITVTGWFTDVWELKNNATAKSVASFKIDLENPAEGISSQKVESLSSEGWPALFTFVNLKKDVSYNLSFSFRQSGIPTNVHLLFRSNIKGEPLILPDPNGDYKGLSLTANEEWKRFSFDFTAHADAAKAQLIFFNTAGKGTFWVDDLKLTEIKQEHSGKTKGHNLLQNGSFESPSGNTTSRGWVVDVWNLKENAKAASVGIFKLDTDNPAKGNYSQQVVLLNNNGWPALFTFVQLKKGVAYKLSFSLRQQGLSSGIYLLFRPSLKGGANFLDPSGDYRGVKLLPGENWTDFSFDFISYRDEPKAQLIFMNSNNPGVFWVDDVNLTEVDTQGK